MSTLLALEQEQAGALIPTSTVNLTLLDDGKNDERAFEKDGQFGVRAADLLTREGHYGFHAKAEFADGCAGTREALWSTYVAVGVDPGQTEVSIEVVGEHPDGRPRVTVTVTPRDVYGNYVGPGRGDGFSIDGMPGSEPLGDPTDLGDGSYQVDVAWDPGLGLPPGIVIEQPDRPGVELPAPAPSPPPGSPGSPSGPAWGLAIGAAVPVGGSNGIYDPGFATALSYRHPLSPRSAWVAGLGYSSLDDGGAGADLSLIDLTLGGRIMSASPGPRFFLQGGVGFYWPESDVGDESFGFHVGAGIAWPWKASGTGSSMDFEMSLEGHGLSGDNPDFLRVLFGWVVRH